MGFRRVFDSGRVVSTAEYKEKINAETGKSEKVFVETPIVTETKEEKEETKKQVEKKKA